MESQNINSSIENIIFKLKKEIRNYDYYYYIRSLQKIPDFEYDKLFKKLKDLEEKYPEFITPDSPTQRIGEKLTGHFPIEKHIVPMKSLENSYSYKEIENYINKNKVFFESEMIEYIVEPKIDGAAVSVIYYKGIFSKAISRGDGFEGDNITSNVKTIKNLPLKIIDYKDFPENFTIRGEVYMKKSVLKKINLKREQQDIDLLSNTRNAASGSLKNLNPKIAAQRELDILFHTVVGDNFNTHSETIEYLFNKGLPVIHPCEITTDIKEIIEICEKWNKKRSYLDYSIDGIVIKLNNLNFRKKLGSTQRAPRWAIAYKYPAEKAITEILKIDIQIGRTGVLTPVAIMKPVELSGSVISKASLYNAQEIISLDIRVGDKVYIEKGGEIIPKISQVISHKESSIPFKMPLKCPACEHDIEITENKIIYKCINNKCPAKIKGKIAHFISKKGFDIDNMGPKLIEQLIEKKIISNISDIFNLTKEKLLSLDRMGDKSSTKLLGAIENSKKIQFNRFIYSLGIENIGEGTAKLLSENFLNLDNLKNATLEKLEKIKDIGEIVANSIHSFFKDQKNISIINSLINSGIDIEESKITKGNINNLIFVITGALSNTREYFKEIIEKNGGILSSSISQKTDYLIAGENSGSKYQKALKLNVKIINETEFIELLRI